MDISSTISLSNGVEVPVLGLGTFRSEKGAETQKAVAWALEAGYRHIDTAAMYGESEEVLGRAAEVGLDVVAVTDHNEIAGGLEALALAERYGVRVIVGEEVKTSEGEVIGLFLTERIPGGLTFAETIAEIKRQGGIVYVPHPFDRMHMVPGSLLLKANLTDVDVIEVFNSRIAYPGFNERAVRFAERHRVPAAAGSDAHVLAGLGTALTGMGEFTGPDDFVEALSGSHIIRRPKSLLYLQSLKLLQTPHDSGAQR